MLRLPIVADQQDPRSRTPQLLLGGIGAAMRVRVEGKQLEL